jgi:hypothetical protein
MKLDRNMHVVDQIIRLVLGVGLIYFGFFDHNVISDPFFGYIVGIFGVINLGSGLVAVCPVYSMAGIRTHKAPAA